MTALAKVQYPKVMIVGYPGGGKTGSLTSLPPAGYELRIINMKGNPDPLFAFLDKKYWPMVDIVNVEDKLKAGAKRIATPGAPTAFNTALSLMDHWTYTDPETGEVVDEGKPDDWGPKKILVLDTMTALGRACMRRQCFMTNRVEKGPRPRDWLSAQGDQDACMEILTSQAKACPVIVIAHLKLIGPKETETDDDAATKEVKAKAVEVVPFRLFPSALGRALPPTIAEHFGTCLLAELDTDRKPYKRVLRTISTDNLDLKTPVAKAPVTLPLESGLATIFEALTKE